jgi:hypothetical protein
MLGVPSAVALVESLNQIMMKCTNIVYVKNAVRY